MNPDKVNMILFTTKYKAKPIRGVPLGGKPLKQVNEAKYLGVMLDAKLNLGKAHQQGMRDGHKHFLGL